MLPANTSAAIAAVKALSARAKSETPANATDAAYLKLSKRGFWVYGADETEVEDGAQWAVNPLSLKSGYICWGEGEVLGEYMASGSEPRIMERDLPRFEGRKWSAQRSFELVCIKGEDKGQKCRYTTTSVGGLRAFDGLVDMIEAKSALDMAFVPHIELLTDSYKHKKYGTITTPVFEVKGWSTLESAPVPAEAEEDDSSPSDEAVEQAAPQRRSRRRA